MTKAQAALLKRLADEAYQPRQYQPGLSKEEAARRIEALQREIELADSF
jgi:hypothetical protein